MKIILLVDDEPLLLRSYERILRRWRSDWVVLSATSGAKALALLHANPVHVLVTDLAMPDMNGFELLAAVRSGWPSVRRIVVTGNVYDERDHERLVGLCELVIRKPFEPRVLESAIADAVERATFS